MPFGPSARLKKHPETRYHSPVPPERPPCFSRTCVDHRFQGGRQRGNTLAIRTQRREEQDADDPGQARAAALNLLARREHSRRELEAKLRSRGFEAQVASATAAALDAEGLLSERRFAESYVHSRAERGFGPVRIRAELGERGVADGDIEAALAGIDDWDERLAAVYARKFGAGAVAD